MSEPRPPARAAERYELAAGAFALAPGVLWLAESRAIVAADAHLAYEDVIGGALPTWSTPEIAALLLLAARRTHAREIVLLGDVIHGSRMSEGAARTVIAALDALRAEVTLTLVAGNHEGRTRGFDVLGETVEETHRDGWLLLHGDRPPPAGSRAIIGHLHPSLHMGGGANAPVFLSGERVIVVPALTPYSPGLDVCSADCYNALRPYGAARGELCVTAVTAERVYPFGSLAKLKKTIARPGGSGPRDRYRRKFLRAD